MRATMAKYGKPQEEIDRAVLFILNLTSMHSDQARLVFYNEWKDKL